MTFYSFKNQQPAPIPFRIRLSNGLTRTDPSSFTPEEIADAGYIAVDDPPEVDESKVLYWNVETASWGVRDKTEEEIQAEIADRNRGISSSINNYRDRLIADGFLFNNKKFDSRPEDQKRISGATLLAFMAITQGAQPGNFFWHGGETDFSWIAQDNTLVPMDAFTVVEFGKTAAEHERAHVFAARTLKDMDPIPDDYTNPIYWPSFDDGSTISG